MNLMLDVVIFLAIVGVLAIIIGQAMAGIVLLVAAKVLFWVAMFFWFWS